jgi:Uncharacterized protein conserved in bacteria
MRIGIPNTLFTQYQLPFWQEFFHQLAMEVVISGDSRKETVDMGSKLIPHEFCIPVKAFLGHVAGLIRQDVDLILIPRMINKGKRDFFCPKLTGLPEIVKYALHLDEDRIFSPEVICNGFELQIIGDSKPKTVKPFLKFYRAKRRAEGYWRQTLACCRREQLTIPQATAGSIKTFTDAPLKMGLLGYAYTLYDPFISKGIMDKLMNLGVKLYTWEMLEQATIESKLDALPRPVFWNLSRILLGAGLHFLTDTGIDGVVYVTPFGCGPDSVTTRLLTLEAAALKKPFLQITLDEHTEDGHLKTRLEAFTDMLALG